MADAILDLDFAEAAIGRTASTAGRARVERCEERTDTNLVAVIRLPNGNEIRCIVKDVSRSGAKIGIPSGCVLPERFMFKMNGRDFVFQARRVWQRDCYVGVRIERIAKLTPPPAAN